MLAVRITPRAAAQIERAAVWWAENRMDAPAAIRVDLEQALTLLSHQPGIGALCASSRYVNLRRLHLSRTSYHVYYRADDVALVVLAFWHASRGRRPAL